MNDLIEQKDTIIKLYENKKSIRAIASIVGCSASGIKRILHKFNIRMRNKCESLNLCPEFFSTEEFDIVLGSALGDGHITKHKKNGESQLYIGHSTKQKNYIEYKYQKLNRWTGCNIYSLFHKINGKTYETLNFITRKNKNFTCFADTFYKIENNKRIKVLPKDFVEKNINDRSLAIWYMDDGYNRPNRGCELCSENFSELENHMLCDILNSKFNLKTYVIKIRKNEHRIAIHKKNKEELFNIIRPHIIPSMSYKTESSTTNTPDTNSVKIESELQGNLQRCSRGTSARRINKITGK